MEINFIEPLSRGWDRMKKALFQPFDLGKWFTVGFTAFLAALMDGHGGGGGGDGRGYGRSHLDWDEVLYFPETAYEWLISHPIWFTLIVFGIVFLFVLVIVLTWVSSRGKFMFLDNVVHDRAEVKKPWYEFSKQGNSLFVWRLIFGLICFAVIIVSLVLSFTSVRDIYFEYNTLSTKVFSIIWMGLYFLALFIIIGYISLFLDSFIVPIMYKDKISTTQAWNKFLPLMSRKLGYFILYGLFVFVLIILVVFAVIVFGFVTCCIGFLLLIIPYIGSVVMLPVSYTFRAFSVDFLEQFGEEYIIYPEEQIEEIEIGG